MRPLWIQKLEGLNHFLVRKKSLNLIRILLNHLFTQRNVRFRRLWNIYRESARN